MILHIVICRWLR